MVARKSFIDRPQPDPELEALLEATKTVEITEAQLQEQRISFAFGNAPDSALITKETVREASKSLRLAAH